MIRMNFRVAFLLAVVSTVACGPSGPQNDLLNEDEGEYVDSDENEQYNYLYEDEEEYVDSDENEQYNSLDEDEEEYEDMRDEMDEEAGEYVELPDWMDIDLDQLSIDKISMLSSAKNLSQLMTLLELTNEQQDKLEEDGPVEIGVRTVGDKDMAECKPELEVVKLESPPKILYLPQCFRLPRCGGCCGANLLSCQPIRTKSIKIKVMIVKSSYRSRRSTGRRTTRSTRGKYAMVDQVKHLDCKCQCRVKEQHCDKSIQEYKESECACVCKNRDEEAECSTKNTHYWNRESCSCICRKTRECSTGEEFSQNTCRCALITQARIFNDDTNVCDSFCVNGEPVKCSCKEGWRGRRCIKPICDPRCIHGICVSPDTCDCQEESRGDQCQDPICDPQCIHGRCVSPDTCDCQEEWRGDQCQDPICDPQCVHGRCVSPDTCACQEGWRGDQCQDRQAMSRQLAREGCNCIPVDECEPLFPLTKTMNEKNRNILQEARCDASHNSLKVCCPLLPSYCGMPKFETERIHGGKEVTMGKYPWIALLGYTDRNNPDEVYYLCGGSVINERYVLTAAHCVRDLGSKKLSEVKLGEWDQSTQRDCDENRMCLPAPLVHRPEKVTAHPKYETRGSLSDDIALIRLDASVNIDGDSYIRAICLPESSMDIRKVLKTNKRKKNNRKLSVAGWGATENRTLSNKLLEVELPLINDSRCNETYNGIIVSGQMCAGGRNGEDSCQGDSGGPLVLPGLNLRTPYLQVGVVSFGPKRCGMHNSPGVYTEVSKYRDWIEKNLVP